MPWLNHPIYLPTREWVVENLRQRIVHFKQSQPLVFICGAESMDRRTAIADYLRAQTDVSVFFAEDVWLAVGGNPNADALTMEEGLAELADVIVVVVESAGSIAELGAFALNKQLQKKLLPILDRRYEFETSFINVGPIRTSNKESLFRPAIYTNLDMILRCASEMVERIERVTRRSRTVTRKSIRKNKKNLLLFLIRGSTPFPRTVELRLVS